MSLVDLGWHIVNVGWRHGESTTCLSYQISVLEAEQMAMNTDLEEEKMAQRHDDQYFQAAS